MPSRQFRSFTRDSEYRDAKYIVIATEGSETEPRYFEDLALSARCRNPRVHIEVIYRERGSETSSAPNHVLRQLMEYEEVHGLVEGDELWIVIDRDKWELSMLTEVARLVRQNGYHLADSNPCFELWLLLHHRSLDYYTKLELTELKENRKEKFRSRRRRLDLELMNICGSYDRSNLKTYDYIPHIDVAIANAKNADSSKNNRWLNNIGSRVYRLAQSIIESSAYNPSN